MASSARRSAHVGELLFLDDVHVQIGIARVLADDHAFVDFRAGRHEDLAALLQIEDRVAGGLARAVGDQRPGGTRGNIALPLDVAVEQRVHDGGAARIGQHLAAQPDQAARRHMELQAHAAGAVIDHLVHLALARAELFDHHADEVLRAVDDQHVPCGSLQLAVDGLGQDLGLAHRQLVAFAAHHLDQDGELQFAAAHHLERVGAARLLHADRDVGQQFLVQAVAQIARGHVLPFAARERRGVDGERHRDGGLVDLDLRQRHRAFRRW